MFELLPVVGLLFIIAFSYNRIKYHSKIKTVYADDECQIRHSSIENCYFLYTKNKYSLFHGYQAVGENVVDPDFGFSCFVMFGFETAEEALRYYNSNF